MDKIKENPIEYGITIHKELVGSFSVSDYREGGTVYLPASLGLRPEWFTEDNFLFVPTYAYAQWKSLNNLSKRSGMSVSYSLTYNRNSGAITVKSTSSVYFDGGDHCAFALAGKVYLVY